MYINYVYTLVETSPPESDREREIDIYTYTPY